MWKKSAKFTYVDKSANSILLVDKSTKLAYAEKSANFTYAEKSANFTYLDKSANLHIWTINLQNFNKCGKISPQNLHMWINQQILYY